MEADTIKQVEMIDKILKEYLRRTRKLLELKHCRRNLIKGIITWAELLVRYSEPFLKYTKDEPKQMEQRTRKLMTMHKALHPRDDFDRLYLFQFKMGVVQVKMGIVQFKMVIVQFKMGIVQFQMEKLL